MAKKANGRHKRESLGQRLARIRKSKAITQVELAQILDIGQSNVSDYERDVCRPNADMLIAIAKALGISADELLGLQPNNTELPLVSRKLLKRMVEIEKLPKRDKDAIIRTIDAFLGNRRV